MALRSSLQILSLITLAVAASRLAADSLPGGRRPVSYMLNDEWIGNGVSFSPYRDGQSPNGPALPSEEEIAADLGIVTRYWKLIRVYESKIVSERTLRAMQAGHLPLKLILGVWIEPEKTAEAKARNAVEIAAGIRLANAYPDQVLAVCVGNENCVEWSAIRTDPAEMVRHIRAVRSAVRQPVTVADDYNFWNKPESKAVAAEIDYIDLHGYALWNGQPLAQALTWLEGIHDAAVRFHAGIPVMIGETGWASRHDPKRNGLSEEGTLMKAEVSDVAQLAYLRQHYTWVRARRVPTLLFEAFDENWKGGGADVSPEASEKHWGVFDAQRRPKPAFTAIIREFYPAPK